MDNNLNKLMIYKINELNNDQTFLNNLDAKLSINSNIDSNIDSNIFNIEIDNKLINKPLKLFLNENNNKLFNFSYNKFIIKTFSKLLLFFLYNIKFINNEIQIINNLINLETKILDIFEIFSNLKNDKDIQFGFSYIRGIHTLKIQLNNDSYKIFNNFSELSEKDIKTLKLINKLTSSALINSISSLNNKISVISNTISYSIITLIIN